METGMKNENEQIGVELLFLLKQQRNLYHQLKALAEQQKQVFWETKSPEDLVRLLSGRRKLIEKLRQVNSKLKPIKANWPVIARKMGSEERVQARILACAVAGIVNDIKDMDIAGQQSGDILSDTAQLACHFAGEPEQ